MRMKHHHLAQRGTARTWYVVKAIPKHLQPSFPGKDGKTRRHLLLNLRTTDLAVALAKRSAALAELEALIREAELPGRTDAVMEAATILHRTYRAIPDHDSHAVAVWQEGIEQSTDELRHRYGPSVARAFHGVATGTATLLQHHLDSWLAEPGSKGPLTEKTKSQRRGEVARLERWMKEHGHPATVEAVTKPLAGYYITSTIITPGVDPVTANARVSCLSAYWKWLLKRTGATVNPWAGQSFRKPPKRMNGEKAKRAFTNPEMVALLNGPADQETHDVIRIGALTGMRRSEIFALEIGDCSNGIFNITAAKSEAGVRAFPIHSALTEIIARRTDGRNATDPLIAGSKVKDPADAFGKRFGRYRQSVGVHDKADDRRHSRIDFHSLRRWFVTQARNAGFDRATVAAIVGHEAGNLTDDIYSGGPDMAMKRRCIEAVRLPT